MTVADVSHHQNDAGPIDWHRVRAGLSGLYIKTTESTGYVDPSWAANHAGAAGIPRGAYHFCGSSVAKRYGDAVAEANHFADVYLSRTWEMRPAYDIEMAGASPAWLGTFRAQFRRRTGVTADRVYTSQSLITGALRPDLWLGGVDTDLWIARYGPTLGFAHPKLALWQYTQSGNWPGFPGLVDLSREMNAWTSGNAPTASTSPSNPASPVALEEDDMIPLKPGQNVTANIPCAGKTKLFVHTAFTGGKNVDVHQIVFFGPTPAGPDPAYLPSLYDLGPGDPLRVAVGIHMGRPGPLTIPAGAVQASMRYSTDLDNATVSVA